MRYAVVFKPDLKPYLDGRALAKIKGSVATYYFVDTSLEDNEIRCAKVVYEENGVCLAATKRISRDSKIEHYYELLLPESHKYFNFGLIILKQGNLGFGVSTALGEAISVMRSDLKNLFDHMISNI